MLYRYGGFPFMTSIEMLPVLLPEHEGCLRLIFASMSESVPWVIVTASSLEQPVVRSVTVRK